MLLVIALGPAVGDAIFYPDVPLIETMLAIPAIFLFKTELDVLDSKVQGRQSPQRWALSCGGARRVDDRSIISGIIHVLWIGCRWEDCPPEYGPATTICNRFNR